VGHTSRGHRAGRTNFDDGWGDDVKKRSAKAMSQRADRAYAEFEALTRKLAQKPKRDLDSEQASAEKKPTR
jgi:hypothetical protein